MQSNRQTSSKLRTMSPRCGLAGLLRCPNTGHTPAHLAGARTAILGLNYNLQTIIFPEVCRSSRRSKVSEKVTINRRVRDVHSPDRHRFGELRRARHSVPGYSQCVWLAAERI